MRGSGGGTPDATVVVTTGHILLPLQSLLRQTQLRSLSKSDTKLHELNRVKLQKDSESRGDLSRREQRDPVVLHRDHAGACAGKAALPARSCQGTAVLPVT